MQARSQYIRIHLLQILSWSLHNSQMQFNLFYIANRYGLL